MRVTIDSKLESSNKEVMTITIEHDPNNPTHDGYAALIASIADIVRQTLVLHEAVQVVDD